MKERLDIIIFGGSGFSGKRIIPQLCKIIKTEKLLLTWGVAGRSEEKLKDTLSQVEKETGEDYSRISIICADVNDPESLKNMTAQAKIIINAVGPYRFLGESVIEACLETRTHHIDICYEFQFILSTQLKYHEAAKEKGVYLISACGLDCIPADLGALFVQKNFEGTLNSIEAYMYITEEGGPYPGALVHYTTMESGVYMTTYYNEVRSLETKVFPEPLPHLKPELATRGLLGLIFKSQLLNKWSSINPAVDRSVMLRTQKYMHETYKKDPIQIRTYCSYNNFLELLAVSFLMGMLLLASKISCLRSLLLRYPRFFSFGLFSHEGPSKEKEENTVYNVIFYGEGWSDKTPRSGDHFSTPPNKTITAKVSGKNGYAATGIGTAISAITILTENDKMPQGGGCYTTGAAFEKTSIIDKLNKYGMKFELNPQL